MEFLYEYGLFFAKVMTFVIAVGIVLVLATVASQKNKLSDKGVIEVTKLNDEYEETQSILKTATLDDDELKAEQKSRKKAQKEKKKQEKNLTKDFKKRVYIIDFDGDMKASAVDNFREEITAVLSLARSDDEIVVRLESAGGMVHSYGLAASQLKRITDKAIPLTVCVDKVAASGGYMMACVAPKICCAPFAIIGSIGVVAQLPNFHRLLKKNDIDFELLTAGEYKRTLTIFGENTDKGRQKFVEDLENTHTLFKRFVSEQRPSVDIDAVATGEIWFGMEAMEQQLVDQLITSDDYIVDQITTADVYHVAYARKKSLPERLGLSAQSAVEQIVEKILHRINLQRFLS